ncbi:MAG: FAD-dependent oxidoreductase [Spirochaetaceae bacterium]|jgi:thioredoxin reductase (NADPH)|nr:FAD-dependent oxidoreductase [Spirochaetaceae bacterium]
MQNNVELLIIGGGPAGLAAGQYGARAGLKTLVVEQAAIGGQALTIDALENYPAYGHERSGADFAEDMRVQALDFGVEFLFESVRSLGRRDGLFEAVFEGGDRIAAQAIVLATGAGRRRLGIPGEEAFMGRGVSFCASCDGPFFKNKKIFVVGGGDAACDEARILARLSEDVTILVRGVEFKAQKALVRRVLSDGRIRTRFSTRVVEIRGAEKVASLVLEEGQGRSEEAADAVFVLAGLVPAAALVSGAGAELRVKLDAAGFVVTDQRMESSVEGLFVAGDVRSTSFRQVVIACGEGAVAAHSAGEYVRGRAQ